MLRSFMLALFAVGLAGVSQLGGQNVPSRPQAHDARAGRMDRPAAGGEAGDLCPPTVDDATFLRRLFLDLQGQIPAVAQSRDFLADEGSFKRPDYVDRLLNDNIAQNRFRCQSAGNLARIWRRMMVPASSPGAAMATQLDPWLAKQFAENTPYDELPASCCWRRLQAPAAARRRHPRCQRLTSSRWPGSFNRRSAQCQKI